MFKSLLPSWLPFIRQGSTSFITRNTKTSGTLISSLNILSQTSNYSTKSSGKISRSGSKRVFVIDSKCSDRCSTRSIQVIHCLPTEE